MEWVLNKYHYLFLILLSLKIKTLQVWNYILNAVKFQGNFNRPLYKCQNKIAGPSIIKRHRTNFQGTSCALGFVFSQESSVYQISLHLLRGIWMETMWSNSPCRSQPVLVKEMFSRLTVYPNAASYRQYCCLLEKKRCQEDSYRRMHNVS